MDNTFWKAVSYVKRSEQRKKVLAAVTTPSMPSEVAKKTEMHTSHVSRALGQLREKDLVELMNPSDHRGRLYRTTDRGNKVLDYI